MNHISNAEERIVTDRLKRKLNEVNSSAQTQLDGIQDHINFNLQTKFVGQSILRGSVEYAWWDELLDVCNDDSVNLNVSNDGSSLLRMELELTGRVFCVLFRGIVNILLAYA
uniref:Uncharacterized protein n=1 Tax=Chenopodium quinoa TaxID=63459 RepID=A0A803M5Q4_CHEQI